MTRVEFMEFMKKLTAIWDMSFDSQKSDVWFELLGSLDYTRAVKALSSLALVSGYKPKIADIANKYSELLAEEHKAKKEYAAQKQLQITSDLHYCVICTNLGIVLYQRDCHELMARCTCGRGKCLYRWSEYQITKGLLYSEPKTDKKKNLYIPDIDDVLQPDEIAVIRINNMSKAV